MNTMEAPSRPEGLPATTGNPPAGAAAPPLRLGRWVVLVLILTVIALAVGLLPRLKRREELAADTKELAVPTVNVVHAAIGQALSGMLLPAEVRPFIEAPMYARASGYVTNWFLDIGAQVKSGDLLAIIDTPELDQELEEARANLAQAQAALALAKVTADRWAELLKTSSVSEQENAEKAADLKLKQANVDAAKATVQRFADLKAFCRVTAPFTGTITARDIDVGDLISPGRELFRLSDTSTLRVFVRVPQSGTPGLAVGADADIIVPEMPGHRFPAKVVRTAGAIDVSSRTLLVELDVDNSKGQIIAGSYAQVSFHDVNSNPPLVLPSNTLLFRAEGSQVGVVKADGTVELRSVIIGRDLGKDIEILSGVATNEAVIINPSDSLVSGAHVRTAQLADAGTQKMAEK
jgi:membrane fusion protein, multidrug efflux system